MQKLARMFSKSKTRSVRTGSWFKPAIFALGLLLLMLASDRLKAAETNFFITVPPSAVFRSPPPQEIAASHGAKESRPAAQDPEGHWGGTTEGFQMSVRFEKESFHAGEPIVAIVLIRNATSRKVFYRDFISLKTDSPVCQFDVLDAQPQPVARLDAKAPSDITDGPHIPRVLDPGTQCRYEVKLDAKFKLDQPGKYSIRARRWVHHLQGDGYALLQSGPATITILPTPPSP